MKRKLFFLLTVTVLLICTTCSGSFTDPGMFDQFGGGGGYDDGDHGGGGGGGNSTTPKGLKVEEVSSDSIKISWKEVSEAWMYYVYRSEKSSGPYEKIGSVVYFYTEYTDTGLDSNTTYYYKIASFTTSGEGAQSSSVSAKTKYYH